ncbi:MAG: YdjC family protein [Firmicutes bacterium]|nr:YdjC family protein [Bacillota bacterium]
MKKLIINADDYGLHTAVNQGIISGHIAGCVTSTTLMACGSAFEDAIEKALEHPSLGVGVHLTLVGEKPLTDAERIPTLVEEDGRFPDSYPKVMARWLRRQINLDEVYTELYAQVKKAAESGLALTHVDSHQHLHVLPGIIDLVLKLAGEFAIPAIRIPSEPFLFTGGYPFSVGRVIGRSGLSTFALLARRKARRKGLKAPDHFFGMLAGGHMEEKYLLAILDKLPDGVSEIMMHPGGDDAALRAAYTHWDLSWQAELKAVQSSTVRRRLVERGITLVSYKELVNG